MISMLSINKFDNFDKSPGAVSDNEETEPKKDDFDKIMNGLICSAPVPVNTPPAPPIHKDTNSGERHESGSPDQKISDITNPAENQAKPECPPTGDETIPTPQQQPNQNKSNFLND